LIEGRHERTLSANGGMLLRLREAQSGMTSSEARIAREVLGRPREVLLESVTELAQRAGVGEATVIRFCRRLGCRGYQEFKLLLAQDLAVPSSDSSTEIGPQDDIVTMLRKIKQADVEALEATVAMSDGARLSRAAQVLHTAARIQTVGSGSSGITAAEAQYKFLRLGKPVFFSPDPHLQLMYASQLQATDAALVFSRTGSTKDSVDIARRAHATGATVISVTRNDQTPLSRETDIVLTVPGAEWPSGSGTLRVKLAQLLVLDVLYNEMLRLMGPTGPQSLRVSAQAVADRLY